MAHSGHPFFKRSLNKPHGFYFTAYLGKIEWIALHGWLYDLEELSGQLKVPFEGGLLC
jgi:hypothetical protein